MKKPNVLPGLQLFTLAVALFLCLLPLNAQADSPAWNIYFGQLHAHSGDTGLIGDPNAVFQSAKDAGLQFFALTDFSHSIDPNREGAIGKDGSFNETWAAGKSAAASYTDSSFVGIYGYEMSWQSDDKLGHISTFATPGWQCRGQEGLETLPSYYQALSSVSTAIGQFNHPDPIHHGDFRSFASHQKAYDFPMALLEVVGETGDFYHSAYQAALDGGWHVAPTASGVSYHGQWGTGSNLRTAILAESLTEQSLYEALRARRVYATNVPDWQVTYSLGGHIMGSRLTRLENPTVCLSTNYSATVEIIAENGTSLLTQAVPAGTTSLTVTPGYRYYYLYLTQEDGSMAITAPVWVESPAEFGVKDLQCSAAKPVQGEPLAISFSLYNHETIPLIWDSLVFTTGESTLWQSGEAVTLAAGQEQTITFQYTPTMVGNTKFSLTLSGTMDGEAVEREEELTVQLLPPVLCAHILVDGRHSDVTAGDIENLTSLAATADMDVSIFQEEAPSSAEVMILPPPSRGFSEGYPQLLGDFVKNGGHLILCGKAGGSEQLNALLSQLGCTMRFRSDTARDPVHNGGDDTSLHPDVFNESQWQDLTGSEFYTQLSGCTVDPGSGTWLVKGKDTMEGGSQVLLAMEDLGSGRVYAAGSFFLDDSHMPLPANHWDLPSGNLLLMESILEIQRAQLPVSQIQWVREGELEGIYRVSGYVTAGTSRQHNRFPDMIYLQDDSGGIAVTSFDVPDIQVGFRLDITGQLHMDGNNPALKLISWETVPEDLYRYDPPVVSCKNATDYPLYGGTLQKIEGTAQDISYTADALGVRRFTVKDDGGYLAEVLVEDCIFSGADGVNHLAQQVMDGKAVRAMGILHKMPDGTVVLRVRNCEEVVYIPPVPVPPEKEEKYRPSNPKTGDPMDTLLYNFLFMG